MQPSSRVKTQSAPIPFVINNKTLKARAKAGVIPDGVPQRYVTRAQNGGKPPQRDYKPRARKPSLIVTNILGQQRSAEEIKARDSYMRKRHRAAKATPFTWNWLRLRGEAKQAKMRWKAATEMRKQYSG